MLLKAVSLYSHLLALDSLYFLVEAQNLARAKEERSREYFILENFFKASQNNRITLIRQFFTGGYLDKL
ncbi:hypothetical protein BHOIPH791_05250 [Bartonella henselae]|nr:hypothetical protein BhenCHDE101_06935 [Bartonella henselae]OLL47352.1 hypothetical protein AT242_05985 [Bartonella henselae]GFF01972.1 hypothetical protein BH623125_04060 [Bartonella henselae]GFF04379.1 hypothetical protein BH80429_12000 [Bartonella henselae]